MKLHLQKIDFRSGSARALACIGRRPAERNKLVFGGAPNTTREGACAPRNEAVALVITLLMLSVITFLTIAFLAMSQRNQSAVSASLDQASAKAMSDAALARAQSEILADMMAHGDPLYYDYKVSTAFQSPSNFDGTESFYDPNNVNYDSFFNNSSGKYSPANYAQNIANLWYDPKPPVFVITNPAYPNSSDFRFWVDINRNGRYETNGAVANIIDEAGDVSGSILVNGEPQFIGILKNPLYPHSSSNQFIGRYAYLVLPIGKELDFNYIGNYLKATYAKVGSTYPVNTSVPNNESDGYARDQGIGSWELNLAGVFDAVSPWAYENPSYSGSVIQSPVPLTVGFYNYVLPVPALFDNLENHGNAFDDAEAILHYRYGGPTYYPFVMPTLSQDYPTNISDFESSFMDMYCSAYSVTNYSSNSFPSQPTNDSWPGSYQSNQFFDVQDLFDSNKTSIYFTNRMIQASMRTNTFDRYTFQRLLSCIGMGSSPEYGVWVYGDNDGAGNPTNVPPLLPLPPILPRYGVFNTFGNPSQLRTKVNINYDNTAQITNANAPYVSMPTNLVPWTPLGFFTNAAELLLRSQTFMFSNYVIAPNGTVTLGPPIFAHFGVTNIPIYRANNPGIHYNAAIHRMLQLAANIYDSTVDTSHPSPTFNGLYVPNVRHPSIFQPLFAATNQGTTNVGIDIVGFVQVSNVTAAYTQMSALPFYDPGAALANLQNKRGPSSINISGIPWVVAANKGLPQFYQYSYNNQVLFERKLQFVRYGTATAPETNKAPQYTNQFYCMSITNNFGLDAFNPYSNYFTGSVAAGSQTSVYISNYITVELTNNYNFGFIVPITNLAIPANTAFNSWAPWIKSNGTNGFQTFFTNTVIPMLQPSYYSEANKDFVSLNNFFLSVSNNQFQPVDSKQTGWPVHNWTLSVTNHVVYALFDGGLSASGTALPGAALLDFVNLGPFGSSMNITNVVVTASEAGKPSGNNLGLGGNSTVVSTPYWSTLGATDLSSSPMSQGQALQVWNQTSSNYYQDIPYLNGLKGTTGTNSVGGLIFGPPLTPAVLIEQSKTLAANDPMVHYSIDDLTGSQSDQTNMNDLTGPETAQIPALPLTNSAGVGSINTNRYSPWNGGDIYGNNMLLKDPLISGATNWAFPTNKFPGVGWLGRVHRGTPWQTVYLKADTSGGKSNLLWSSSWATSPWFPPYETYPETYPANDWALVDLFTAAPNDNAARGLLSVNQTNDAAWAAVFAGVIAPTNSTNGIQIMPINDVSNLVDLYSPYYGINALRTNYANGIFHKVGDILATPALTTQSPFFLNNGINPATLPDEIVERIPQQTLSLLKVGEPQFVIYSWGQSLKPKGPPYLNPGGLNNNIYTNYEITGEVLTRTVAHLVHTNGLKMVIDSYNVESGSGN